MRIKQSLETPLSWNDREFVVPVDLTMGFNFSGAEGVEMKHKNFPTTAEQLAIELKSNYNKLKSND